MYGVVHTHLLKDRLKRDRIWKQKNINSLTRRAYASGPIAKKHKSADRSSSREAAPRGFIDRKNRRQSVATYSNPPEMGNVSVRRVTQTSSSQTTLQPGSRRYSRSYHQLPPAMLPLSPHDSGHSDGTATTTSNDTTPPNSGTPVLRRRPQDLHSPDAGPWVDFPGHAIQTTTTFPSRNGSAYMMENNAFTPNDDGLDRGFPNEPALSERAWDTQSADYSHMAPTATSSSSSMIPSMYPQNTVNKVAVAPQPQKKSSSSQRHSRPAFDDSTHRHSARHSHGNPIAASTPNQLALRNPNRVSRVSNEVYIDGPPPISPVVDYRYSASAWDERSRDQYDLQKKLLVDKDLSIAKLEGRMIQMTKDMSAKECECENIKKSKDSIERAYKDTKREADNYADRLACCQRSNAQLRKESEEDRAKFQRQLEEKIAEIEKLQSGEAEKKLRSSLDEASKRNATLQDEILLKSRRITELEATNAELQRRLEASTKANRRHSGVAVKEESNGFETLTEADSGDDLWVATSLRSDANRTPTMPRSASSNTSLNASLYLPANFETLLRSHYRKTMGIDSLASALSQVVADMFSGKTTEAARVLGAYTDTEGEESEAIVSEAPDANAKISIGNAERYLRKENDMLDRAEKRLLDIHSMYRDAVRKGVPLKR
uniref:Myosin_tail_1 domain-containing protein n=1 Tax=Panagrellus redivivus TaxID=6233 RepID=A0A7E4VBI2_PANRE